MKYQFVAPTLFGLEGIVADELRFHGKLTEVRAENGRVFFSGNEQTLAWANIHLRCAERILILVGTFTAKTFDALFEGVKALPWEDYIPLDGAFPVKGHSLNSALHSIPDCQKIIKKAVVDRLSGKYSAQWFTESGAKYQIQFAIMKDRVELYLDTSGAGLHKRGYRAHANAAPLRETLAAAMIKLARFRGREDFIDPLCGSGTIPIEAAMIAMRRAPGLTRRFAAEHWAGISPAVWEHVRQEARADMDTQAVFPIYGTDLDPACVALSQENAQKAGVAHTIQFQSANALTQDYQKYHGILIANPPYGERMLDVEAARKIYAGLGSALKNTALKQYIISPDAEFEAFYGRKADKRRKLYNGMIKCDLHMYYQSVK